MVFHRSLWLGALGAIAALAAIPSPAGAVTSVYSTYAGWSTAQGANPIYEYTCIPNSSTGCGGSSTGTQVNSIPLGGTTTITNGSPSSLIPMYSNQAQMTTPWTSFWPPDLKTGASPYTGDVWDTNSFDQNGNPVTQITLNLSPSMSSLGFAVLPGGLGTGTTFTVSITGFGGTGTTYSEKDKVLNGALTCNVTAGTFADSNSPSPCGFFGFKGGSTSSLTVTITDNSGSFCEGDGITRVAAQECDFAGIGIGDFVDTLAPANVPEPSSLALLGAGLIGLGLIRRRLQS